MENVVETKKKSYLPLVSSLYFNYIFQGMAAIIISQNITILTQQWQATTAQVALVISAIGLGRILSLYLSGYISDRFGRKKTNLIGIACYFVFFGGLLFAHSWQFAFVAALFGGFSNAFLDTSTYPAIAEAYPKEKDTSSLSVLNRAFISIGQFILPILTRMMISQDLFFGIPFLLCIGFLLANMVFLKFQDFPENTSSNVKETTIIEKTKAKFAIDGVTLLVFSFICISLFNIFILWAPTFAQDLGLASEANSLLLISVYSIGSFICVFLNSAIVKKGARISLVMSFHTGVTTLSMLTMTLVPNFSVMLVVSFLVGGFAAAGIWQLGLALCLEYFPEKKGRITGMYSMATSVSLMIMPFLTGFMVESDIRYVFYFAIGLGVIGFLNTVLIAKRHAKFIKERA